MRTLVVLALLCVAGCSTDSKVYPVGALQRDPPGKYIPIGNGGLWTFTVLNTYTGAVWGRGNDGEWVQLMSAIKE